MAASRGRPFRVRGTGRRRGAVAASRELLCSGEAQRWWCSRPAPPRREAERPRQRTRKAAVGRREAVRAETERQGNLELGVLGSGGGAKAEQRGGEGAGGGGKPSFLHPVTEQSK